MCNLTKHKVREYTRNWHCHGEPEEKLDITVMGTITGAPLLPFCVLVTEA